MNLHALTNKSEIPADQPKEMTLPQPVSESVSELGTNEPSQSEGAETNQEKSIVDNPRANRHYTTTDLPTLSPSVDSLQRQEILFKLYGEVCSGWRMLTDVRFKLLGLIPVVSGAVLFNLLSDKADGPSAPARMSIALFGLLITIALFIYNRRNSELYDDMISRGRKIEAELGVDTGLFLGRREPSRKFINHSSATNLIYGTAMTAWLVALIYIGLETR